VSFVDIREAIRRNGLDKLAQTESAGSEQSVGRAE